MSETPFPGKDDEGAPEHAGARPSSRRYLFALTDGGGTLPPEYGVARRLAERGHRVTMIGPEGAGTADDGIEHLQWSQPDLPFDDWSRRSPLALARGMADVMIAGPAPSRCEDVLSAIDASRPDLVVTSFVAAGAMIAAEARNVPYDVLIPNVYPMPAPGLPPFGTGLRPLGGPAGRLRDGLAARTSRGLLDRYALPRLNAVRTGLDLAPIGTTFDQMHRARRELILTASAFDFPAELPPNARYVGPILDDPHWAGSTWLEPGTSAPLVLVAMSSTFQGHLTCLQRIIDALGTLPVRGIVTTGPAVRPGELTARENVDVVAAAPHAEVMRRAAAVVTHGGHGTVMKTLTHGLPLVVLPHGRDQNDNATRVTFRGAGIRLSRTTSSRRIARAVRAVITEPRYRGAAQQLGNAIRAETEHGDLLAELEDLPLAPH